MWEPIISQNAVRPVGQYPPIGDITHLFLNTLGQADIYSTGAGYTSNTLTATIPGPGNLDFEVKGTKFPIRLTVHDTDTGTGTTTTTDVDLGPSATTAAYTLAAGHECATLAIRRRF
jgi:hypothetical protein